jgi:hypothetical protein
MSHPDFCFSQMVSTMYWRFWCTARFWEIAEMESRFTDLSPLDPGPTL